MALRPVIVIVGVGNGSGTGAATAQRFAKAGWGVALIARDRNDGSLEKLSKTLNEAGGDTAPFLLTDYTAASINSVFKSIQEHFKPAEYTIRATLFNAAHRVWKPFLEHTQEDFENTLANVNAAWFFARESILAIKDNEVNEKEGKKGTIIFTGATASVRGNVMTSSFSTAKHGIRALSQSLAKEFGKQGIHVAHAIVDGGIKTGQNFAQLGPEHPTLEPDHIAEVYYGLVHQNQSSSTWELDLRPLKEKW